MIEMKKIKIKVGNIEVEAELNDTKTAGYIYDALPITAKINTWGDEIYFSIPVKIKETENSKEVVELGDLGYWKPGHAFCIFFGQTPNSRGDEIRPASAVNVFGKVIGDPKIFKKVKYGEEIIIEKV